MNLSNILLPVFKPLKLHDVKAYQSNVRAIDQPRENTVLSNGKDRGVTGDVRGHILNYQSTMIMQHL